VPETLVTDADVVVLGGGAAGLAAAYRLAVAGRSVVLVERAPVLGGLAASFEIAGVRVDHGSHRLHPATPAPVMADLQRLLGPDLQRRRRRGRMVLGGRLVAFPPKPLDLARRLPPRLLAGLALDTVRAPLRQRDGRVDERAVRTFADAVDARFGPTMLHEFYGPFARKLFGAAPDDLDAELARRRIGARSGTDVLRRARSRDPNAGVFFYPRHGFGEIVEALADAARDAGAHLRTSTAVLSVHTPAHAERVDVGLDDGSQLRARHVFSTLPAPLLANLAGAPDDVLASARALEYRALVLVYLVLERAQWTPFDAHYFPATDVPMTRVSEPKNYRASPDDPTDVTVLCAELPCAVGDTTWAADAGELGARVASAIERSGLPPVAPVDVVTRRVERAYPVYRVGFAEHFALVDEWASSLPNVVSFGRQALFAHDNTHHAFTMAWDAAAALRDAEAFDADAWSDARVRFREHVVED
jgi:protoporphyrinogen oxidase